MPEEFGNPWMTNLVQPAAPEAVPWWPPAPGWYVLAALVFVGFVWLGWRAICRWQENAYRRVAERLIDQIADCGALDELPEVLKRTALSAYPRADVASLSGDSWLAFLDGTLGTTDFIRGAGRPLADLGFLHHGLSSLPEGEKRELLDLAMRWVKGHKINRMPNFEGGTV